MSGFSEHQKERFSRAFIEAAAAASSDDTTCDFPKDDVEGVDVTVRRQGYVVDFQLKSTAGPKRSGDHLNFDLEARTYNLFVNPTRSGLGVLALVVLHEQPEKWVDMRHEVTSLAHCAYYLTLTGMQRTANTAKIRLRIPLANRLTPAAMRELTDAAQSRWRSV